MGEIERVQETYPKGGPAAHDRHVINDDAKWLSILRGLNAGFGIRLLQRTRLRYISNKSGPNLSKVFDQYLQTTNILLLKYNVNGKNVSFLLGESG
jgi:hypothetical protein